MFNIIVFTNGTDTPTNASLFSLPDLTKYRVENATLFKYVPHNLLWISSYSIQIDDNSAFMCMHRFDNGSVVWNEHADLSTFVRLYFIRTLYKIYYLNF